VDRHDIILASVNRFLQTRRVFVIIVVLGLFTMAARGVKDPDVWWHLRTGQLMLATQHAFHTDPYSFTRAEQLWIDHEWLSQVLIFGLYRVAGWGGLIVGFGVVVAAGFLITFLRCPGRPYLAGLIILCGAFASAPSWGVRPQMFTFLLASVFLLILERSYQRPNLLWWTPFLMLLWVNLHGGYALGIAFLVLFLLGDALDRGFGLQEASRFRARTVRLALALAVCVAVVPLNPYGIRLYWYPLQTLRSQAMQSYIGEWASPDFHKPEYLPVLLMMLATLAFPALSPRRLRPRELVLLLTTTYAALRSVRHIPIYALVAVPILSTLAQAWWERRSLSRQPAAKHRLPNRIKILVNAALLGGFLVFTIARVHYVVRRQAATEERNFPAAAVAFLSAVQPPGPILNHYNWGGYFIWKLYPQYRVFIDGRADLYGDSFMNELATAYYLRGSSWQELLEKWSIRTVVLPVDAPLVTALRARPNWKAIHADEQAVVLTRTD